MGPSSEMIFSVETVNLSKNAEKEMAVKTEIRRKNIVKEISSRMKSVIKWARKSKYVTKMKFIVESQEE